MQVSVVFVKKEQVASDTYTYYFERKNLTEDFLPGQYMRMTLPITATDGRGSSHFFTISSSPTKKDFLTVTTKRGQSDFKNALFGLTPGTPVQIMAPIGGFLLRPEDQTPKVFLAGGIGITPFHSMITYAADLDLKTQLTLIVSFSTVEEIVFYDELTEIEKTHNNIKIIYSVSHPENSNKPWTGDKGRISEELIKKYIPDIMSPVFMVVGPPAMVDATEQLLKTMNIPLDHIKVEQFTGY